MTPKGSFTSGKKTLSQLYYYYHHRSALVMQSIMFGAHQEKVMAPEGTVHT